MLFSLESASKGLIIISGFCYNDELNAKKSQVKLKLIQSLIRQNISEPIFEEEITTVYEKEILLRHQIQSLIRSR